MSYNNILNVEEIKKLAADLKLKRSFKIGFTYNEIYDLIKNNKKPSNYIFNLLGFSHKDNQLGHYIACIIDREQKKILIYTCYGIISYDVIKMFYQFPIYDNCTICFDLSQHQKINSNSCGWYCLRWLKQFDGTDKINIDNFILFKKTGKIDMNSKFDEKNIEEIGFNVNSNWNENRYKKYTKEYLDIIHS